MIGKVAKDICVWLFTEIARERTLTAFISVFKDY